MTQLIYCAMVRYYNFFYSFIHQRKISALCISSNFPDHFRPFTLCFVSFFLPSLPRADCATSRVRVTICHFWGGKITPETEASNRGFVNSSAYLTKYWPVRCATPSQGRCARGQGGRYAIRARTTSTSALMISLPHENCLKRRACATRDTTSWGAGAKIWFVRPPCALRWKEVGHPPQKLLLHHYFEVFYSSPVLQETESLQSFSQTWTARARKASPTETRRASLKSEPCLVRVIK